MKQLLEQIKQELIARCKACIQEFRLTSPDASNEGAALMHFREGYVCFTQLFDTEEEVLEWLEDEHLI